MKVEILGCEQFLLIDVTCSDNLARDDWRLYLDSTAISRLGAILCEHFTAFSARAKVAWIDAAGRSKCLCHELSMPGNAGSSRWSDVQRYATMLRSGSSPRCGPVFLHPGLTKSLSGLLLPIDGARRMMAAAEVGAEEIDAVVICPSRSNR